MAARKTLTFVTGNPRKLEEVQLEKIYTDICGSVQLLAIVGNNFPLEIISKSVDRK